MLLKLSQLHKILSNNFNSTEFKDLLKLLKIAAVSKAQEENRKLFESKFPNENLNKTYAIADQYFKFTKNLDYKKEIDDFNSLNEIINYLKEIAIKVSAKDKAISEIKAEYPEFQNEDAEKLKNSKIEPKYYEWIVNKLFGPEQDPLEEIIDAVELYQKNKVDLKSLELYSSLSELRADFDEYLVENKELYLKKIEPHAHDPQNTDFIYSSDNFIVVHPGTIQSSQYWASGTVWCTSYLKDNMYANYAGNNIYLYYVINKNSEKQDSMRKFCVGFIKRNGKTELLTDRNATVDINNRDINLDKIKSYLGEEAGPIISSIYQNLENREDTKFKEIIEQLTPEQYHAQLAIISDKLDRLELDTQLASAANLEVLNLIKEKYLVTTDNQTQLYDTMYLITSMCKNKNINLELIDDIINWTTNSKVGKGLIDECCFLIVKNASNDATALASLAKYSVDTENETLQSKILNLEQLDKQVLEILINTKNDSILEKIIVVNSYPDILLNMLDKYKDNNYILYRITFNKHLTEEILEKLFNLLKEKKKVINSNFVNSAYENILKNPILPEGLIREASNNATFDETLGLAKNPKLPEDLFFEIRKKYPRNYSILLELTSNKGVPGNFLDLMFEQIIRDDKTSYNSYIIKEIVSNENISENLAKKIIYSKENKITTQLRQLVIVNSEGRFGSIYADILNPEKNPFVNYQKDVIRVMIENKNAESEAKVAKEVFKVGQKFYYPISYYDDVIDEMSIATIIKINGPSIKIRYKSGTGKDDKNVTKNVSPQDIYYHVYSSSSGKMVEKLSNKPTIKSISNRSIRLYKIAMPAKGPEDLEPGELIEVSGDYSHINIAGDDMFLDLRRVPNTDILMVKSSGAPHGFGPLLYDIGLGFAYWLDDWIIPDRDVVSTTARAVWEYYYNNRADIDKQEIDELSHLYRSDYPLYLNTMYRAKDYKIIKELAESGHLVATDWNLDF